MKKKSINNDESVIIGDCLHKLAKLDDNSVDLIYLDPPFFTQKKQSLKTRDNKEEYSFDDCWPNISTYTKYIKDRLFECNRVLKKTGSIFLHCDRSASHHLRFVLDEVFGSDNFQSEIVWSYKRWSNAKTGLLNCHQIIYFYSKTKKFKFNTIYDNYSPTTNIDQIFQKRVRDTNGKTIYKKNGGAVELIEKKKGVPLSDVWQIPYLNPKAKERVGYPTQKPLLLLERIINITTDVGDMVLDPFCGSGTTLVAAKILNRKYCGIDISKEAIALCKSRLENPIKTESNLLKKGESAYINQNSKINEILQLIGAVPVQRNKGIDGFLIIDGTVRPIPVKIHDESQSLEDAIFSLLKASERNKFSVKILITNNKASKEIGVAHADNLVIVDDLSKFSYMKTNLISKLDNASIVF